MSTKKGKHPQKGKKLAEKWYYDACSLDANKEVFSEIADRRYPKIVLISHLALGEAYGNCYGKGENVAEAFIDLINSLRGFVKIIGNDGSKKLFDKVRDKFPRLSITDSIHLATAIKYQCNIMRTIDPDLCKLSKKEVLELAQLYGISKFSITSKGLS